MGFLLRHCFPFVELVFMQLLYPADMMSLPKESQMALSSRTGATQGHR